MKAPGIWLRTICRKNGLIVGDEQIELFERYVKELLGWNRKINLISRQDEELVWQNHILHSVSPLFKLKLQEPATVMDLGTGGGLPGIPLKILLPDSEILLVDATRKKIMAVQEILVKLNLPGIRAIWGRAEDLANDQNLLSHFDYIVARGVATLDKLISWCGPFLRPSTAHQDLADNLRIIPPALIAFKGGILDDEIREATLSRRLRSTEVLDLVFPGSEEMSTGGKKIVVASF